MNLAATTQCSVLTTLHIFYNACFSLKNPAKYVGRKPRKYTVPVPVPLEAGPGGVAVGVGGRASGRSQRQPGTVDPIAAQAGTIDCMKTKCLAIAIFCKKTIFLFLLNIDP